MKKGDRQERLEPRKRPTQQRSRHTHEAILEAAARILEVEGSPFTTNHVARLAGVSIGSLYQYFPNSTSILAALIQRHVAEEVTVAEAILAERSGTPEILITSLTLAFVDTHARRPKLASRLHSLAPSFGLDRMLNETRDAQADVISAALDIDPEATKMAVAAVEGALLRQLAVEPVRMKNPAFLERLTRIALTALDVAPRRQSRRQILGNSGNSGDLA